MHEALGERLSHEEWATWREAGADRVFLLPARGSDVLLVLVGPCLNLMSLVMSKEEDDHGTSWFKT